MKAWRSLALALALAAALSAETTVALAPAVVAGPVVTLGEIAAIASTEPELAARLAGVVVDRIDDAGPRRMPAVLIRGAINRDLPGTALTLTGTAEISRRMTALGEPEILAALTARHAADPPDALRLVRWSGAVSVPSAARRDVTAEPLDPEAPAGELAYRIVVRAEGREWGRFLAVAAVERTRLVAVAARDLARGTVLQPGDLRIDRRSTRVRRPAPDLAALAGMVTTTAIVAGAEIPAEAVAVPPLVRGGQEVALLIDAGRFTLTTRGVALADGVLGAAVAVRRATDGRTVQATVSGPGELRLATP